MIYEDFHNGDSRWFYFEEVLSTHFLKNQAYSLLLYIDYPKITIPGH